MKKVQAYDAFQRINFLYQISKQMAEKNCVLSAYYGNLINNVAKKNVLKVSPDIKRQVCKKCRCMLLEGVTAAVKIKNDRKKKSMHVTCNTCRNKKIFPADKGKDHRIWVEKPESTVEVIS